MSRGNYAFLFLIILGSPICSWAAVVSSGAGGFVIREDIEYSGSTENAWHRLVQPKDWWDPEHTYSHDSSNLSLTLVPGGCWCEKLSNGGFVRHMEVIYVERPVKLRFSGALGPLQAMGFSGALTFTLESTKEGATHVRADYTVSGYSADGFTKLAEAVDGVLGKQLQRFASTP
jgi:hypothetical protein